MKTVVVRKLSMDAIGKILLHGTIPVYLILGIFGGLTALAGHGSVTINNEPVRGFPGLIVGVILGGVLGLIFALLNTIMIWFGMLINPWSRKLSLTYIEASEEKPDGD